MFSRRNSVYTILRKNVSSGGQNSDSIFAKQLSRSTLVIGIQID